MCPTWKTTEVCSCQATYRCRVLPMVGTEPTSVGLAKQQRFKGTHATVPTHTGCSPGRLVSDSSVKTQRSSCPRYPYRDPHIRARMHAYLYGINASH